MADTIIFAEEYGLLCAVEVQHEAATVTSLAQPFFKHFLATQLDQVDQGQSKIPDAVELKALSREAQQNKLAEWRELSRAGPVKKIIEEFWRICTHIKDVLEG